MSRSIGKKGEKLFQSIMSRRGQHIVNNVSDNPLYYYKGDFELTDRASGISKMVEVKFDTRINDTQNLYLELTNVNSKDGIGWFQFCQADFVAYGDAVAEIFYIIPLDKLHERVQSLNLEKAKCGGDSTGYKLPLKEIEDLITIKLNREGEQI